MTGWHRHHVTTAPVPLQCQMMACGAIAVPKECHRGATASQSVSETPQRVGSRRFQPARLAHLVRTSHVSSTPSGPRGRLHHFLFSNGISAAMKPADHGRWASLVSALFCGIS
jgi:hypothetical protein